MKTFVQDPNSSLDYIVDWSAWLTTGDTIDASVWTVETGITTATESNTDSAATVWLSGGTINTKYKISNKITTVAGRIAERSFVLLIKDL